MKHILNNAFYLFGIVLAFHSTLFAQKIDRGVQEALIAQGQTEALVVLVEQADLSFAQQLQTKEAKGEYVFQKLKTTAERSQAPLWKILHANGLNATPLWIVNALYLPKLDLVTARLLAAQPGVQSIISNPHTYFSAPRVEANTDNLRAAIEWGINKIGAPEVWAKGFNGKGVVIAGQDTGYDWEHPTLKKKYRGTETKIDHNYNWHDGIKKYSPLNSDTINPCGLNSKIPCDDDSHGTHTMGTMLGDDEAGNQIGVAPGARWIGCRNMERGWGSPASYLDCFQWFLAPTDLKNQNPNPKLAPHVINNSWGCPDIEGCGPENWGLMQKAIVNLRAAGVVVVVSAGNAGAQGCSSVNDAPSFFPESFSIGATRNDDVIARFSSRGPVKYLGSVVLKPNVSAPGQGVRSSIPKGGFATFSGTSMAGPHVAGAVALIISANPALAGQVEVIETLLEKTAVPLTDTMNCAGLKGNSQPNPVYGYGRINVLAAVEAALKMTTSVDTPTQQKIVMQIAPNPVTEGMLQLELGPIPNDGRLELLDATGRLIQQHSLPQAKFQTKTLTLSALPAGTYIVRITAGNAFGYQKIVKI
jgi:hypothetical protein